MIGHSEFPMLTRFVRGMRQAANLDRDILTFSVANPVLIFRYPLQA